MSHIWYVVHQFSYPDSPSCRFSLALAGPLSLRIKIITALHTIIIVVDEIIKSSHS